MFIISNWKESFPIHEDQIDTKSRNHTVSSRYRSKGGKARRARLALAGVETIVTFVPARTATVIPSVLIIVTSRFFSSTALHTVIQGIHVARGSFSFDKKNSEWLPRASDQNLNHREKDGGSKISDSVYPFPVLR
jgi:hypothetical protein